MKAILLAAAAALCLSVSSAPATIEGGNAGVCLTLNATGQVVAAKITDSSGDAQTDAAILQIARQYHWDKPYPPAGGLAVRIGFGIRSQSNRPGPPCDGATTS